MCIAILHQSGAKMISRQTLKRCWRRNPHGAGYFWQSPDGKFQIKKGFMDFEDFWWNYKQEGFTQDTLFGIHFRWATSGGQTGIQTRPFPVSTDRYDLKNLDFTCDAVLMHNGVLGEGKGILSDTMLFCIKLAKKLKGKNTEYAKNWIAKCVSGNRVCIADRQNVWLFGNWIEASKGLYFSNDKFKKPLKDMPQTYQVSAEHQRSLWSGKYLS